MRQQLGVRGLSILGALVVVSVTVAACGGDDAEEARERLASLSATEVEDGSDGGEAELPPLDDVVVMSGSTVEVNVIDNTFDAENVQVAPGTRVVWTNNGRQDHDIVPSEENGWGVDPADFQPDAVYEHTFDEPGTYRYYCTLHGTAQAGMTGAVVVE
jgi:plastocyanin